jgi:uncharacterized membrane protein required for colicin V production
VQFYASKGAKMNWIDIAFLVTVALLVLNGLKNGALFSLVHLIGIPIGFAVAYFLGPQFTVMLASAGLPMTPILAYIILFFGAVLILHILGTVLHGVVKNVPLISQGDALLGGVIGFIEAWLIWLLVLSMLGAFLHNVQAAVEAGQTLFQGIDFKNLNLGDFQKWHDAYNEAVTTSLFAKVNGYFITVLPAIKAPEPLK